MIERYGCFAPKICEGAFIHDLAYITGRVTVSAGCVILPFVSIRGDKEPIWIGENTNIQDNCVLHTSNGRELIIGGGVSVGHGAILHSCTIGSNCLIGMGSVILDGSRIMEDVILAAGSVVYPGSLLESGFLYGGRPAEMIRKLSDKDHIKIRMTAENYALLAGKAGSEGSAGDFSHISIGED